MKNDGYIGILDPLRGIAALAVVFFHYSGSLLPSIEPNALTHFFSRGNLGVHAFFVISGYVIPYSLWRANYRLGKYGWFMLRRWARIAPPAYLAAMAMIVLNHLSILRSGTPIAGSGYPGLDAVPFLANLTFTVPYFGEGWYNFVYWTLTIEFEFYLLIGLLYPLLRRDKPVKLYALLIGMLALVFIPGPNFFQFAPFFLLGSFIHLYRIGILDGKACMILLAMACGLASWSEGPGAAAVGAASAAVIFLYKASIPHWLAWLGVISYSLYITHVPVGIASEFLVKQLIPAPGEIGKVLLLFLYTFIALMAAWGFNVLVERPTHQLARHIGGKRWRSK